MTNEPVPNSEANVAILSPKTRQLMELWASGRWDASLTIADFQAIAKEVLAMEYRAQHITLEQIRKKHPKAYSRWTPEDDTQLKQMLAAGRTSEQIAEALKRQPSAIRSRLSKLA